MAIELSFQGRLARITFARPPLNIFDQEHLTLLGDRVATVAASNAAILVLDAAPDCRAFSAGNAVEDHAPERAPAMLAQFHRAVRGLLALDAIVVADVAGPALGGGCELCAVCDLVYATPGAKFGQPEINVGCFPPVATAWLPRRVGWTRAVDMIVTGRRLSAEDAWRAGLVTEVGSVAAVRGIRTLLTKSPDVLRVTKAALRAGTLGEAETLYRERLLALPDAAEGVRAFLEKRAPQWMDRRMDGEGPDSESATE